MTNFFVLPVTDIPSETMRGWFLHCPVSRIGGAKLEPSESRLTVALYKGSSTNYVVQPWWMGGHAEHYGGLRYTTTLFFFHYINTTNGYAAECVGKSKNSYIAGGMGTCVYHTFLELNQ